MKSASQLRDEEAAKYKSAIDCHREEVQRQYEKASKSAGPLLTNAVIRRHALKLKELTGE